MSVPRIYWDFCSGPRMAWDFCFVPQISWDLCSMPRSSAQRTLADPASTRRSADDLGDVPASARRSAVDLADVLASTRRSANIGGVFRPRPAGRPMTSRRAPCLASCAAVASPRCRCGFTPPAGVATGLGYLGILVLGLGCLGIFVSCLGLLVILVPCLHPASLWCPACVARVARLLVCARLALALSSPPALY